VSVQAYHDKQYSAGASPFRGLGALPLYIQSPGANLRPGGPGPGATITRLTANKSETYANLGLITQIVGRCGVVGSTPAFGSIGHGFESEHRLFSHHGASAFSKLRSLANCSLDDSVCRLL